MMRWPFGNPKIKSGLLEHLSHLSKSVSCSAFGTILVYHSDYNRTTNFLSIVLDDHWSKKIYRPKMIVWSCANIHPYMLYYLLFSSQMLVGQIKGIECCPKQGESFLSNFSTGNVTRLCIKGATQCSSFRKSSLIRDFYLSFYLPTKQN